MSKEKKFHQLIEELDQEQKQAAWQKIKEKDTVYQAQQQTVSFPMPRKRGIVAWKKAFVASFVSIIVVGAGAFIGFKYFVQDDEPTMRYCDASMYEFESVQITLKERSIQTNESLLYLDWYEITDYYADIVYCLKDTNEEIGYKEEIIDINTGSIVFVYAIKNQYQLAELDRYIETTEITDRYPIQVGWESTDDFSYANFSYDNYNYCVVLENPMEEGSILEIIEEMLLNI